MSLKRTIEIKCPGCGTNGRTVVREALNASLDPRAKEELLAGKVNQFHCDICGFEDSVPVGLLYHDMELEFIVQFFPFQRIEDDHFFTEFTTDAQMDLRRTGVDDPPGYFRNVHIVFSMDELVRYVVFRDKLSQKRANNTK